MMKSLVAGLGAALVAVPAMAGGLSDYAAPVVAAPMAPAQPLSYGRDWTGGYVGAQIGYGGLNADGTDVLEGVDTNGDGEDDELDLDIEGDGFTYGLRSGYDYDFGRAVLGGLIAFDGASIDTDGDDSGTDAEIDRIARAGLRLGYDAGNTLPYLTAGYAYADTNDIGSSDGYFAGLGAETFLTDNVTVGAEVLYHNFEGFDNDFEADVTTVGLNVNYRF